MTTHIDRQIFNLGALQTAVEEALKVSGRRREEVYIETLDGPSSAEDGVRFRLVERRLSDGSTVFDAIIGG